MCEYSSPYIRGHAGTHTHRNMDTLKHTNLRDIRV